MSLATAELHEMEVVCLLIWALPRSASPTPTSRSQVLQQRNLQRAIEPGFSRAGQVLPVPYPLDRGVCQQLPYPVQVPPPPGPTSFPFLTAPPNPTSVLALGLGFVGFEER